MANAPSSDTSEVISIFSTHSPFRSSLQIVHLILKKIYKEYINIEKRRNSALKYLGLHCVFGAKYNSYKEIVVKFNQVCSRILSLNDNTYCIAIKVKGIRLQASNCILIQDFFTFMPNMRNKLK